jgi:hypothetical protein
VNPLMIGLLGFGCTFGASLLAMRIRCLMPSYHVRGQARDAVKLVLGLVASLTALVLGLLVSSGYASYEAQKTELQKLSVRLYQTDRALAYFGADTHEQRSALRELLVADMARVWPADSRKAPNLAPASRQEQSEALFSAVQNLSAGNETQRMAKTRALELLENSGESWNLLAAKSSSELSRPMSIMLLSWLTVLFFGFGLLAPFNKTVAASMLIGSMSVSGALVLIADMNQPYTGWMRISSAPLQSALVQMNH